MFLKGQYFLFQLSVLGFMQTLFPLAVLANCHCYYHSSVLFYFTVSYFFCYTKRYFVLYITVQVNTSGCCTRFIEWKRLADQRLGQDALRLGQDSLRSRERTRVLWLD